MKEYSHIFFDLDRTLWDFDRNSGETLRELYEEYDLYNLLGIDVSTFVEAFREINAQSWRDFRLGSQTKEEMRTNRFVQTFFKYGCSDWKIARKMSNDYIEICPYKSHLVDGAQDILDYLVEDCDLHIITNGFSDTQRIKIESSGIVGYFRQIVISDETNYRKPQPEIFNVALKLAGAKKDNAIMIGDDWHKDIMGAKKAGIDQIFYNPEESQIEDSEKATHEVRDLREISERIIPRR